MPRQAACEHVRWFSELTEDIAPDNMQSIDIAVHSALLLQIRRTDFGPFLSSWTPFLKKFELYIPSLLSLGLGLGQWIHCMRNTVGRLYRLLTCM